MAVKEAFGRDTEALRRRMAMTRRGRMLALQVGLDQAAVKVAVLGHEKWAQWTVYFLEVVDGLLGESDVSDELRDELLRQVRDSVEGRLEAGMW